MRGGRQTEASTLTIAARGVYTDAVARAELVTLIGIVIAIRARRAEPVFHDRAAGTRVLRG